MVSPLLTGAMMRRQRTLEAVEVLLKYAGFQETSVAGSISRCATVRGVALIIDGPHVRHPICTKGFVSGFLMTMH